MQRYDHPAQPLNPYPEAPAKIAGFRYDSALVLIRLKDAVQMRSGEDADYLLGRPFLFSWHDGDGNWRQISVPEGLITDLTSVPRLLRWIAGRVGPWLEAAILHDYLYIAWQDVPGRLPAHEDRRFADDMMLAAMRAAEVNPMMAWAIHKAVSVFGAKTFEQPNEDRYVNLRDPVISDQLAFLMPRLSVA